MLITDPRGQIPLICYLFETAAESTKKRVKQLIKKFEDLAPAEDQAVIDKTWRVTFQRIRAAYKCPFGDGLYADHTYTIENQTTGQALVVGGLIRHILDSHDANRSQHAGYDAWLNEARAFFDAPTSLSQACTTKFKPQVILPA